MMLASQLELSAWRFLAAHRVGGLAVTHVSFIDGDDGPTMNTPSVDGFYESASGSTFSEAAVNLALALGMPCEHNQDAATHCPGTPSECADDSSSVPTASHRSGVKPKNSRRTRSPETGSTTGVTSAAASTDESGSDSELSAQTTPDKLQVLVGECRLQALEASRAGRIADAHEWRSFEANIGRLA